MMFHLFSISWFCAMLQKIILLVLTVFRHLGDKQQVVFQIFGCPGSQAPTSRGRVMFLFLLDLFLLVLGVSGTPVSCMRHTEVGG